MEADGEDAEMAGAEDTAGPSNGIATECVDEEEYGSEDLEAESSGSEEEDLDVDEDEVEVDEDIEMGDEPSDKHTMDITPGHQQDAITVN